MFEQPPRSHSDFWKLIQQGCIEDKEDLHTQVGESNDDLIDNPINFDERIDLLKQLSDNLISCSTIDTSSKLIKTPSASRSSSAVVTTSTKHDTIRKIATDHCLSNANKKMKLHQDMIALE